MTEETEKLRRTLSANLKKYRKKLGFSQEKLAETADLSEQTINDIEGCRMWVSDKTLVKLSKALNIEVFQLILPHYMQEKEFDTLPISAILRDLQRKIDCDLQAFKEKIDLQFDEAVKSGLN